MNHRRIAIATHKGGTAKTVTAISLASALAEAGHKVLLIDLDPQGHSTLGLGVETKDPTMSEFFIQHPSLPFRDVVQHTDRKNLDIAPSDLRLARAAETVLGRPKRDELLLRSLKQTQRDYDWIIFDTPPSLGVLTQNAIAASDYVLIPCVLEARAVNALADVLELVQLFKGDDFEDYGILITRVDSRKTRSNTAVRDALHQWNHKVFKTFIPQCEPLNQAQMAQQDIFRFDKTSTGATAYNQFLDELISLYEPAKALQQAQ